MPTWLERVRAAKASAPSTSVLEEHSRAVDLHTAIEDLTAPVPIWSNILQADFGVCATLQQAAPLRAEGKVVYLPEEIRLLHQLKERCPDTFPDKLQAIHRTKQDFGATLCDAPDTEKTEGLPQRQSSSTPGACYTCGSTQRWQSSEGAEVCVRCHPPTDPAFVATGREYS